MAFPDDAVDPMKNCLNSSFTFPAINLPGLPSYALAGFTSVFAGVDFLLDFLPPDAENLPSLPSINLFTDPIVNGLVFPGDLGELDFSLVIPGGPTIPATGLDIQFNQFGLINMALTMAGAAFGIITDIVQGVIDNLTVTLPTLQVIIDTLTGFAVSLGLPALTVQAFIGCFANGFLDILGLLL